MNAIETHGLTRRFGNLTAVDGLDLNVREGELLALLGVNGAGKTTTVRMLATLLSPTSGDAEILGHSLVKEAQAIKRLIAISPQDSAVAPNLTVWENLRLMADLHGLEPQRKAETMEQMIERFRLQEVLRRRAGQLSGGWQRRLSIAMALVCEPKILFLDEPTLGLDVIARRELWGLIEAWKGKTTILLTTHLMQEAEALSDRVAVMKSGRLLQVGTPKELMDMSGSASLEDAFLSLIGEEAQ